jgi:hypothetical protein
LKYSDLQPVVVYCLPHLLVVCSLPAAVAAAVVVAAVAVVEVE